MTSVSSHNNPFTDSAAIAEGDHTNILESTLNVGNNATLTLSGDGVIVVDEKFQDGETKFCGLVQKTDLANLIPYYYVLNAEFARNTLKIKYVRPKSAKKNAPLRLRSLIYNITTSIVASEAVRRWTERLMENAYGLATRQKRIKVLVNPFGGAGRAQTIYNNQIGPLFEAAGCVIDVQQTTHRGHAVSIAEELDIEAYDVLACASGDGLPMECFNGFGLKKNAREALRKIAVVQLPCGTGNAMSWNLNGTGEPSQAALAIVKGVPSPLDLASITQGDKRTLSFLSQSLGIVAESDLGTENIRWMGDFRFTFGFLVRVFGKTLYPIDYAVKTEIDSKDEIKRHYAREVAAQKDAATGIIDVPKDLKAQGGLPTLKYGTINDPLPKDSDSGWTKLESYPNLGNFYCGNMCWMAADAPFFPASLPNDGLLDLVNIDGDISRMKALKLLLAVGNGTFFDEEIVRVRKISAVRVIPRFGRPMTEATEQDQTSGGLSTTHSKKQSLMQRILGKLSGSAGKYGYFAVDGEQLPWEPFQIEIHRGLGTALSRTPGVYQYKGPNGWQESMASGPSSTPASMRVA